MAELKTKKTAASVEQFLDSIVDEGRREDCRAVAVLMEQATGASPDMWGANIVGFGRRPYKYANGKENDWFIVGFSPRKQNLTLYLLSGDDEKEEALLQKLGKHKRGQGCLYLNRLADADLPTLKRLVEHSVKRATKASKSQGD